MKRRFESFEPTPFYFLNDTIDREELVRQFDFMRDNGIGSYFLHLRDGITTQAWGTDIFYANVRFIAEESFKRGITMWLYDEDSFPSGQCGGHVVIDRPELEGRSLVHFKQTVKAGETVRRLLGRAKGVAAYTVKTVDGKEVVKRLNSTFGPVRRNWYRIDWPSPYYCDWMEDKQVYNHVRAIAAFPEVMFEAEIEEDCDLYVVYTVPSQSSKYNTNLDCTRKESFKEYKKRILDPYKAAVGDMFGTKIPGVFIDEPTLGGNFSEELCEYFYEKFGYRVEDNLYKLNSQYDGDAKSFKRDFAEARKSMFRDNFLLPLQAWCHENNLKMTGHFSGEEDPLGCSGDQSIYRQTKIMDIPGFDIITTNIGNLKYCALVLGANIVSSAAAQTGKARVLAESFALSPFNMNYHGLKKTADWLFVCGITWIVPHGFHYGYNAFHRADAGKSFFFQDVHFEDYKTFASYAGRVCKLLCEYKRENDVLLVYPDVAFSENVPYNKNYADMSADEMPKCANNAMRAAVRYMMGHHIGWDMADPQAIFESEIADGRVKIGECSYSKVVVVKGGETELEAFKKLRCSGVDTTLYDGTDNSFFPCGIETEGDAEKVQIYRKTKENSEMLFVFNNSEDYRVIKVKVGENTWVYDAEEDISRPVKTENGFVEIAMQGYGSIILVTGGEAPSEIGDVYVPADEIKELPEYVTNPEHFYKPVGTRSVISNYYMKVESRGESKDFGLVRPDPIRNYIGTADPIFRQFYYRPGFDIARRFYDMYPCKIEYTVKIDCVEKTDYLLFDKQSVMGAFRLFWNGVEIPREKFEKKRVYDVSNFAVYPEWRDGENVLEIKLDFANEFDGATGDIFVMKA
jgi:hypothetical protein